MSEIAQAEAPVIEYADFQKVDLRVARILTVEEIPGADKLYKLGVDDGTMQVPRTLCAGIKQHYKPEELLNRYIVIVANLAPRKMRGIESNGMLLAATDVNGRVILVQPSADILPGSKVS